MPTNPFLGSTDYTRSVNNVVEQLQSNPIFQMLKGKGMSSEQIVRYLCHQRGISVEQLLQQAQTLKGNFR